MAAKKFTGPAQDPYATTIQSKQEVTTPDAPAMDEYEKKLREEAEAKIQEKLKKREERAKAKEEKAQKEVYKYALKMPEYMKIYLAEMAWQNKTTINQYIVNLIEADVKAHPEWLNKIDALNFKKD